MAGRVRNRRDQNCAINIPGTDPSHLTENGIEAEKFDFNEILLSASFVERNRGERLRRHLQFFFMDPIAKWKVRRQIPYKLLLQIFKIVFVTVQLILFAELRMAHVDFMDTTNTVLKHRFLKRWSDDRDAVVYPPSSGQYSVFTGSDIIDEFAHMVTAYYSLPEDTFASFSYDVQNSHPIYSKFGGKFSGSLNHLNFSEIPSQRLCIERLANVTVYNNTYEFDIRNIKTCSLLNFTDIDVEKIRDDPSQLKDILEIRGITFKPEDALIISKAKLSFNLRTIHFSPVSTDQRPECYRISVSITFDNSRHTGQVHIFLSTFISYVNLCNGRILHGGGTAVDTYIIALFDVLVLTICLASLILCLRALFRAYNLMKATETYYKEALKRQISCNERLEFLNLWYVMIVVNDFCIITGTLSKITIEFQDFDNNLFTVTGVLLGVGSLLVYVGILRYLMFFPSYNILILTIKNSLPAILRFGLCAFVLYVGFWIAGWVIIGPYSLKFRTLEYSSEALFSLINGDDMFATFFTINNSSTMVRIIGKAYIYVFVSLFIYVVLSLFIAIIMDAYEKVKERQIRSDDVKFSVLHAILTSSIPSFDDERERQQFARGNLLNIDCFHFIGRLFTLNANRGREESLYNSFNNPVSVVSEESNEDIAVDSTTRDDVLDRVVTV